MFVSRCLDKGGGNQRQKIELLNLMNPNDKEREREKLERPVHLTEKHRVELIKM